MSFFLPSDPDEPGKSRHEFFRADRVKSDLVKHVAPHLLRRKHGTESESGVFYSLADLKSLVILAFGNVFDEFRRRFHLSADSRTPLGAIHGLNLRAVLIGLDAFLGEFLYEARFLIVLRTTVDHPLAGVDHEQPLFRSRDGDIGEATLTHDMNGFHLSGDYQGEHYEVELPAATLYSCHIE